MTNSFRVLCAVDFLPGTDNVFNNAIALTCGQDAHLTILNVTSPEDQSDATLRERAMTLARMRQMAASAGVQLLLTLRHGVAATVILEIARDKPFDLIVLGTRQRSRRFLRFWSGSVSARVIRGCTVPVLVVPTGADTRKASDFRVVLCPTDLTPSAMPALEQAVRVALWSQGHVTLLHVFRGASARDVGDPTWYFSDWDARRLYLRAAWLDLERTTPSAVSVGAMPPKLVAGNPSEEIVRLASDLRADVVVMRRSARGALRRRVFGSIVERVRRQTLCSVLVLPPRGQATTQAFRWPTRQVQRRSKDHAAKPPDKPEEIPQLSAAVSPRLIEGRAS